eukprot:12251701-Alexandrium_andersonii.AAC.1
MLPQLPDFPFKNSPPPRPQPGQAEAGLPWLLLLPSAPMPGRISARRLRAGWPRRPILSRSEPKRQQGHQVTVLPD